MEKRKDQLANHSDEQRQAAVLLQSFKSTIK